MTTRDENCQAALLHQQSVGKKRAAAKIQVGPTQKLARPDDSSADAALFGCMIEFSSGTAAAETDSTRKLCP